MFLGIQKKSFIKKNAIILSALLLVILVWAAVLFLRTSVVGESSVNMPVLVPDENMPYLGREDAPITLIAFSDPLCPGCKTFFDTVEPDLRTKYIETGLVKVYHWPMVIDASISMRALRAMYCAKDQDKYWEYRDVLESAREPGKWADDFNQDKYFIEFADAVNLDINIFVSCLASGSHDAYIIEKDVKRQELGIHSSTTVLINGEFISLALHDDVMAAIERILLDKGIYH